MTAPRLTLHGYWRSSSAWRVRIGLHLKGLAFAYRAVNLLEGEQRGEAHRAVSPLGQVPVLTVEEGGPARHLVQSMAILEWLEERFPAPPLLPGDAWGRARVRALAEHVNSGIQPYQNAVVLRWMKEHSPDTAAWTAQFIGGGLANLEAAVRPGAGRFCHGDEVTLADLYLVPQLYGGRRFGLDLAPFPTLLRVEASCQALEAFRLAEPARQPDAVPEKR